MHSFFRRLIVFFTLCLISFISYSSQIFVIWPWYGREVSVDLLTLLVPFNILVGLLLWNYSLSVLTDPGRVPDAWQPDTHADGYEVKKLTGAPRHCRMCKKYKPPRAHHCRQCNRCVLKMDHHCPWINNCVGHFNHGHFIRFLFFVDVACSYHIAMVTMRVFYPGRDGFWDDPSALEFVMIILNYCACIPVLFTVGCFSCYHFYSLVVNTTTLESWEKDRVAVMVKRGETRQIKFPYDLGVRRNIESILGPNPLLWCCPSRTPGSGLKYELSNNDGEEWPRRECDVHASPIHNSSITKSSPWTYENESLNPNLQPSNTQSRRRNLSQTSGASSLPPYHPDYKEDQDAYNLGSDESWDEQESAPEGRLHVRRGSEGYEIRPEEREVMLRRYLTELGEKPGRYLRYIPQPDSEEITSEDDVPLTQRKETIGRQ